MKILLHLIVYYIVNLGLTAYVQTYIQTPDQTASGKVNYEGEMQENFQNLFDSISKNDGEKSGFFREILQQQATKEQRAFVAMKEELQNVQHRNSYKKRNVDRKNNFNEHVAPIVKRWEDKRNFTRKQHPNISVFLEMRQRYPDICEDLIDLNLDSFMMKSILCLNHLCRSMSYSHSIGYRNFYNDILAAKLKKFNRGSDKFWTEVQPGLIANNNETTFLFEFIVGRNALEAMAELEKYRNNFLQKKRDVLCVGINFHYIETPHGKNETLNCDYTANLYSETGELKRTYPQQKLVFHCK